MKNRCDDCNDHCNDDDESYDGDEHYDDDESGEGYDSDGHNLHASHSSNPSSPLGVGGLESVLFQPTPYSPSGWGGTPPPSPIPWTWAGSVARGWSVQDGPRRLQERLGEPEMASKMAEDSPRCLKMASKIL